MSSAILRFPVIAVGNVVEVKLNKGEVESSVETKEGRTERKN